MAGAWRRACNANNNDVEDDAAMRCVYVYTDDYTAEDGRPGAREHARVPRVYEKRERKKVPR